MTATSATAEPTRRPAAARARALALLLLACTPGCAGDDGDSARPAAPPTTPTEVDPRAEAPAIQVAIVRLEGASGPAGSFHPGDRLAVTFDLLHEDGTPWLLEELTGGAALVSGPTFNYQRVLPLHEDVTLRASRVRPGRYRYVFAEPLPAVYAAPYNDSADFGPGDGELTGTPLLAGTYTLGLSFAWKYTVTGEPFLQVGEATLDFLLGGGGGTLRPRQATSAENCNRCHVRLEAHRGRYRALTLCLACHTSGAEDLNDPAIAGGTPGVSIDSRVLFHRIHNASRLPSTLGVGIHPDGTRDYAAVPRPLLFVSGDGEVHDYTTVGFPVWPNRTIPMPRDLGYSQLQPFEQFLEDRVATGITACYVCHGDPDGAGPLGAPAEGELHWREPLRRACGACHDDVDWELPYVGASGQRMDPQPDDALCFLCHDSTFGGPVSVTGGHLHPLRNPDFDPGFDFELLEVVEAGVHDADGTLDPGEGLALRVELTDDAGQPRDPAELDRIRALVSGPSENAQLVLDSTLPVGLFSGAPPYTVPLPEIVHLELLGTSTAAVGETFTSARAPHVDLPGAVTRVLVRTGAGAGASALAAPAVPPVNFVDVVDASGFQRDDFVVLDDGVPGFEEYLRVQHVAGTRLWFSSPASPDYAPGPRLAHPAGASVVEVVLALKTRGLDYSLDAATGRVLEMIEFGAGREVVATYATPFVLPAVHGLALHASPDLGEESGKWTGKALVSGTYRAALSGYADELYPFGFENEVYRIVAPPAVREFLVGDAALPAPYSLISSGENCQACHQDLRYHEGTWRGFDTCITCHGTAGAEDRPPYVAANAPATPGVRVDFRFLLHRIHRGVSLANPGFFTVASGTLPAPNNYSLHFFAEVHFPPLPGATRNCAVCHGITNTAWIEPAPREHPSEPGDPIRTWTPVCVACHDAALAVAHIENEVSAAGVEICALCHGAGQPFDVVQVHRPRSSSRQ